MQCQFGEAMHLVYFLSALRYNTHWMGSPDGHGGRPLTTLYFSRPTMRTRKLKVALLVGAAIIVLASGCNGQGPGAPTPPTTTTPQVTHITLDNVTADGANVGSTVSYLVAVLRANGKVYWPEGDNSPVSAIKVKATFSFLGMDTSSTPLDMFPVGTYPIHKATTVTLGGGLEVDPTNGRRFVAWRSEASDYAPCTCRIPTTPCPSNQFGCYRNSKGFWVELEAPWILGAPAVARTEDVAFTPK